jgi:Tfp pilus assembly protein PilW
MAIMLIVSGAAFSLLIKNQNAYSSTAYKADMHAGLRSATELLEQEIGQAGLLSPPSATLSAAVTASGTAQTVSVSSTAGMYVGEKLQIDVGTSQETVTLVSPLTSTSIKGIFSKSHNAAAIVSASGIFYQGILSVSSTQLQMFGDINGDGTMVYVQYDCDTTAGTLSRSITPWSTTASAKNPSVVLVDNLFGPAGVTTCLFQSSSTTVAVSGQNYTFVTQVGITLTTQTRERDPLTGQFGWETKTFLNLYPRNVVMGTTLANAGLTQYLQPTPSNLPLT